ncbi:cilia- and flagella-associated protein HOATZ [Myxocyprinus asiaticus]|uniref:cilia- and flagella-associated protein HOATZ n=1 Tax=Myxocyprinus asiaticus TaxID=70543 RepID=UPI0022230ED2|nr:cilia- and flagella-associated protein HOATZ [Myxocyprinus asiaticus]
MAEELDEKVLDSLAEIDKLYTVFDGASQEDVAHAKLFWNSLSLQPPIESRLVSADVRQRLKVAKGSHSTNAATKLTSQSKRDEIHQDVYLKQKQEERQKYMEMAKKRDQIIALLKKQRYERIKKEMISIQHKPRKETLEERLASKTISSPVNEDQKEVQELQ